jgi:hypothetical protein
MFSGHEDTASGYQRAARISEKMDKGFAPTEQYSYEYKAENQQAPVYPRATYPNAYEQKIGYAQEQSFAQTPEFEPEQLDEQPAEPVIEKTKRRHPKFVDRFIKRNN